MKIGDKVVCISGPLQEGATDDLSHYTITGHMPDVGKVYVIRGFWVSEYGNLGLKLIGISAIFNPTGEEVGWCASRFRKLDELKQEAKQRQGNSPEKEYDES